MIVLSNCLTQTADEGCLKVAVSLVKRLKQKDPHTVVVGYERESPFCDQFLTLNKWMLSRSLWRILRQKKQPVLFAPFSAKLRSTALRALMISLFARGQVLLLQPMYSEMDFMAKFLLKLSGAKVLCLSQCTYEDYRSHLGNKAVYVQTGVDTKRFTPGSDKQELRKKYNLPVDKPIVLHVGHLKEGRNIAQFQKLSPAFHGLVVVSTHTPDEQSETLRQMLNRQENVTLLEGYQPNIEELYRLSDVYLFPVAEKKSCIDVPLSALEAAACGIPVVTTPFREMQNLIGKEGFYEIGSFEPENLNALLQKAADEKKNPREAVLPYDWDRAIETLTFSGSGKEGYFD